MRILLTGSTGFIGSNVARVLVELGHQVKSATRSHGIDFCQMGTSADWLPHLKEIDAVINCVGIIGERGTQRFVSLHTAAPCALFKACALVGIRRVIQISALGADETAFSQYHLSKREADECLRSLDLDWFVLRPSLIYGKGGKSARLFMRLASLPLIPVIGDGRQRLQPVHISDVVHTVVKSLTSEESRITLDILGSETLSFAEWLQWMRRAQGKPPAGLLHIPVRWAFAAATFGRHINPLLQPENLRMLQTGYWADFRPMAKFLGRDPLMIEAKLFFSDCCLVGSSS